MNSMMIFEVLWIIEVVLRELVPKVAKEANMGKISEAIPVQVQGCTGTPPTEANLYRYTPTECNLYWYRCAQNAQNVVFLYN